MDTDEFHWRSIDELNIYGKYWAPDKDIKGVVCLVHGMGEHCNRYGHVGKFLSDHGIALIGYDQRGHGKSEGKRGHTPSFDHLLQGIDNLIHKAKELFPELPLVLYGHSMGGNLVINYAIDRKPILNGVIASSPFLKLAFEPPAIKVKLGELVKNIFPAFSQSTGLDAKAISRIPEEVQKYENDPLVHDRITAMMFTSVFAAGLQALQKAEEIELPLLLFHGSGDKITSFDASKEFAAKVKNDVTFREFEGAYHETHNDLCREEVLNLIKNWVEERL
jgi:alpha-beta hydrolase superfamily lysophospholipase